MHNSLSNPFSVNFKTTLAPDYTLHFKIWIDINKDGDFNDSNELIFSGQPETRTSINLAFSASNDNLLFPGISEEVYTSMRIGVEYINENLTPCSNTRYGEFEDYAVLVL